MICVKCLAQRLTGDECFFPSTPPFWSTSRAVVGIEEVVTITVVVLPAVVVRVTTAAAVNRLLCH